MMRCHDWPYTNVCPAYVLDLSPFCLIMSPAQWSKSNTHIGNAEQCALAFIFLSHYTVLVILNMSPTQWCKSNTHIGNAGQCVLAFIFLSHYTVLVILNMSPAQWCKSNTHIHSSIVIQLHQLLCTIPSFN